MVGEATSPADVGAIAADPITKSVKYPRIYAVTLAARGLGRALASK
jgi:hypothetical protein